MWDDVLYDIVTAARTLHPMTHSLESRRGHAVNVLIHRVGSTIRVRAGPVPRAARQPRAD